jgi:hypothetical protein
MVRAASDEKVGRHLVVCTRRLVGLGLRSTGRFLDEAIARAFFPGLRHQADSAQAARISACMYWAATARWKSKRKLTPRSSVISGRRRALGPNRPGAARGCMTLRQTLATGLQPLGVRLEVTEAVLNQRKPGWRSRDLSKARPGRGEARRTRRMVCAPSRRGGRQADCRKGVAIQPSGLRRDVAEAGSCPLGIVRTAHQRRPRGGQQRVPHLLQQCAGALDLGVAPRPQFHVEA